MPMFPARDHISCGFVPNWPRETVNRRRAFTLVELLVSIAIVSILASLSLAGLATVRQRSKADKTRSTIRKLHEIIMPHYEGYLDKRVTMAAVSGIAASKERMRLIRLLMAREMPQSWQEVFLPADVPSDATAPPRAYAAFRQSVSTMKGSSPSPANEGAECLAMIVMRGGFAVEEFEHFRGDELGDVDNDGASEFVDGWSQPIGFLRWPTGFRSVIQLQDASRQPDPFDPMGVSDEVEYPLGIRQRDYAVFPLIVSQGPDGVTAGVGIKADTRVWTSVLASGAAPATLRVATTDLPGEDTGDGAAADNISNHDLNTR